MDQMTATEVSMFLYSLRLVGEVSDGIKAKYMNPRCDLGPVEEWVDGLLQRGDSVVLAGRYLNDIEQIYKMPVTYWSQNKIAAQFTLWCLGMLKTGYECRKKVAKARIERDLAAITGITSNGITEEGVLTKKRGGMVRHKAMVCSGLGIGCDGLLNSTHMFMPGPGAWKNCYWEVIGRSDSKIYSKQVNNIKLYFGSQWSCSGRRSRPCRHVSARGLEDRPKELSSEADASFELPTEIAPRRLPQDVLQGLLHDRVYASLLVQTEVHLHAPYHNVSAAFTYFLVRLTSYI
ncbi:hypothetical protein FNYG_14823 [Fusarium nygamai]|uniref:Uncharacterized protein n=1 Tax=Gibberella nygamai TaxID=42673 RepID=A0A2K0UPY4_GIBNY|nr:hypothetical protein FNYG_14823 [Fusarium nygamai]